MENMLPAFVLTYGTSDYLYRSYTLGGRQQLGGGVAEPSHYPHPSPLPGHLKIPIHPHPLTYHHHLPFPQTGMQCTLPFPMVVHVALFHSG